MPAGTSGLLAFVAGVQEKARTSSEVVPIPSVANHVSKVAATQRSASRRFRKMSRCADAPVTLSRISGASVSVPSSAAAVCVLSAAAIAAASKSNLFITPSLLNWIPDNSTYVERQRRAASCRAASADADEPGKPAEQQPRSSRQRNRSSAMRRKEQIAARV